MRRALHALVIIAASVAVFAAAGELFYGKYPFTVYTTDMKERKDFLLEVREIRRDERSSLVTVTITPEFALSPDLATTHVCYLAFARGKSYFTMKMESATPPTYIVSFPESMDVASADRGGEPSQLVRSVKMCVPSVTR